MIARFSAPASTLEQSQDQLHLLVEQVREYAIFLLDTSGHVHTWNTGAERIKGYQAAEIVGQHFSVFYTPEEIARGTPARQLARAEAEGHCEDEGWRVRKDGSLFWASVVITALRGPDGDLRGFGKVTRDMTQRRSDEERRAGEKVAQLASIIESSGDAVVSSSLDGIVTSWNRGAEALYGYTASEIVGRSIALFIPPECRSQVAALVARLERGETISPSDTVHRRKDGSLIEVSLSASAVRNGEGDLIGIATIGHDITDRKRIERALRESEEAHRIAVDAARLGMWAWIVSEKRIDLSVQCKRIYGLRDDAETSEEGFLALLHPDDRERIRAAAHQTIAERSEIHCEYRVIWPDGSVHWVSSLGRCFVDEAGRADRLIGVVLDVTSRKQAEDERAELLEREKIARATNDFLAVLSHELRTPLHSIVGWTQMLKSGRLDETRIQKALATIDRNVMTQTRLIEDLLDVSRIIAGKLRLELRPLNLTSAVELAVESTLVTAEEKSIQLVPEIEAIGEAVLGDHARLQQVLWNLICNAIKFTPSGGRVTVRLRRDAGSARITVEDTGRGIAADFLPQVFDRFRQAESARHRSHGGLGLGLSIVQHLVDEHGGTVSAESAGEGRGSTFTVTLPLVSAPSPVAATPRPVSREEWRRFS